MNINPSRYVVLDTETTGMNKFGLHYEGHRIIEIGAVEIVNRCLTDNQFHTYLNPNRPVDPEAFQIHGINDQFLINQPIFLDVANNFLEFINNSVLVIHNASFDLGFLNFELSNVNLKFKKIESCCTIIDSLKLARRIFPGQRNSLDALCERYCINNSNKRVLHNALFDAKILAYIFLIMTGGQTEIEFININKSKNNILNNNTQYLNNISIITKEPLKILYASESESLNHEKYLDFMEISKKGCLWRKLHN